ncbi:hypothetical protein J31TS4_34730 [Paenibacillus sp. J31TS4]|uniref:hypothetical protein n=1 Tax=Paenibacillus sp. J31TS4 TaxID=2807195 RepID=UPI001B17A6A8|nr:hypothetical protein [Paenibacillus sp. J31TS4]GIP40193.1 hypothetical protein J31TS4_34730 [Paenibacillus sp. J31TS4]
MTSFQPTQINIGGMTIRNADQNSTISLGSVWAVSRKVTAKKSQGFGQQLADRTVRLFPIAMTLDDDLVDQPGQYVKGTVSRSPRPGSAQS